MQKARKTYRLSPRTIAALKDLQATYPDWTETALVEAAIQTMQNQLRAYELHKAQQAEKEAHQCLE